MKIVDGKTTTSSQEYGCKIMLSECWVLSEMTHEQTRISAIEKAFLHTNAFGLVNGTK